MPKIYYILNDINDKNIQTKIIYIICRANDLIKLLKTQKYWKKITKKLSYQFV